MGVIHYKYLYVQLNGDYVNPFTICILKDIGYDLYCTLSVVFVILKKYHMISITLLSSVYGYILSHMKSFLGHKLFATRKNKRLYFLRILKRRYVTWIYPWFKGKFNIKLFLSKYKWQKIYHIIHHRKYSKKTYYWWIFLRTPGRVQYNLQDIHG